MQRQLVSLGPERQVLPPPRAIGAQEQVFPGVSWSRTSYAAPHRSASPAPVVGYAGAMRPRQQSPQPPSFTGRIHRVSQPQLVAATPQLSLVPPPLLQPAQSHTPRHWGIGRQQRSFIPPAMQMPAPMLTPRDHATARVPTRFSQPNLQPKSPTLAMPAGAAQQPQPAGIYSGRRSYCSASDAGSQAPWLAAQTSGAFYSFVPAPIPAWAAPNASHGSWVPQPTTTPGQEDISPYLRAAQNFEMNQDFDLSRTSGVTGSLSLPELMAIMKRESAGKRSIQALADKLMLHRMLENLNIPQLPALYSVQGRVNPFDVERFVDTHLTGPNSHDIVLKPSHLSNGNGVLVISRVRPEERTGTITYLVNHMEQFLRQNAGAHESLALQSLTPGFLIQPRYQSVVAFKTPLELRVIVLWGKVRMGLWWWGRNAGAANEAPHRNVWLVRQPCQKGELGESDCWEAVHEHLGTNPGFENAVALFKRHMPAMAATAEVMAKAFGAPFLRCDFFVGSAEWGVRLNEVAYGCGVDYRALAEDNGIRRIVDDAPCIARILQEGMLRCRNIKAPEEFLSKVGAEGSTYSTMTVAPLRRALQPLFSSPNILVAASDNEAEKSAVPEELCRTMRPTENTIYRHRSFEAPFATPAVGLQAAQAGSWLRASSAGLRVGCDASAPGMFSARPSLQMVQAAVPVGPGGLRY